MYLFESIYNSIILYYELALRIELERKKISVYILKKHVKQKVFKKVFSYLKTCIYILYKNYVKQKIFTEIFV